MSDTEPDPNLVPLPPETPIAMTKEQYDRLGNLFLNATTYHQEQTRLTQAAATVDRCDGSVPELTRVYIRALDGYASEPDQTADFLLKLAKLTATGDLLEEIRRCTNARSVRTWPALRAHILEHFLSACETLKLQAMLEQSQQKIGETTSAYIRRFRTEAERAYPDARAPTEEHRVVSGFLRGFADRTFAERLFRTHKVSTLAEAIAAALTLDADRERMEQVFANPGHEAMEIGVAEDSNAALLGAVNKLSQRVDKLGKQLTQMGTGSKQVAGGHAKEAVASTSAAKKEQQASKGTRKRRFKWEWAPSGQPICNYCREAGHVYRSCPKRTGQPGPQPETAGCARSVNTQ